MTFLVQLKDVVVAPDRGRRVFVRIGELSESIKKFGLIHPIVVAKRDDNRYDLVAGERRYKGCLLAGLGEVQASLRSEVDEAFLKEIELEENVCRNDISFEEQGIMFDQIRELKKLKDPSWGIEKTAQQLNRSVGDIAGKIKVAKVFKERPDIKAQCAKLPYTSALKKIDQIKQAEEVESMVARGMLQLTTELLHGDCLDLIKTLDKESVDLLVTDPPFGLQKLENLRTSGSKKMPGHSLMGEHHNQTIEQVRTLLSALAPELYRVLKPGAHFYMFCGFQYVGDFINALLPHLEFQPPLLIWDRGRPSSPAYGYNYMSRAEAIIFGHRLPRGRRLHENKYNIFECPDVPSNLRMYPTEKPIPLLIEFIKNSSNKNDLVLDPFAGSGSTLKAARQSGRKALGFEINKESYLRTQQSLIEENHDQTILSFS